VRTLGNSQAPAAATASLAASAAAHGGGASARAVDAAISGLRGPAGLVLVFPTGLDAAVPAPGAAAPSGATVAGMTGTGAIAGGGAIEEGCSAIAFERSLEFGVGVARGASGDQRDAGRVAATEALSALDGTGGPNVVLLFLDTRSGDQSEAIAGASEIVGPDVPIAGGAAGGPAPAQIVGGEAIRDAVIAIGLRWPGPVGIGARHGCRREAAPSTVTRSKGRLLLELDGRPAAAVYQEKLGFGDIGLPDEAFERIAVTHPLAQPEPHGGSRIRHVLRRQADGLLCATHFPVDATVEFTHEEPDAIIAASGEAVREALVPLGGRPARAALLFDCAGRKRAVAALLDEEVFGLTDSFSSPRPPLAGLFTHGEIARVQGEGGDLNHAVVVVALG
jgi:hypothetical protein